MITAYEHGLWGLAVLIAVTIGSAPAQALVIEAESDIWIRESDPTGDYEDDFISVWDGTTSDQRRYGVAVFDLSPTIVEGTPITINTAFIELFDREDERSTESPIVQEAFLLQTTPSVIDPPDEQTPGYTWEEYTTFDEPFEQQLDSLGAYNVAAGDIVENYEWSSLASAADITRLEAARDAANNNNRVAFIFKATSGERDWGDIELQGTPPRLVINEDLPVLGDFTNDGEVTVADFNVMAAPENWLELVPLGTRFDLTGDGFIDLRDFTRFKPIFLAHNPGASLTFGSEVPEPSTLIGTVLMTLFGVIRYRSKRTSDQTNSLVSSFPIQNLHQALRSTP